MRRGLALPAILTCATALIGVVAIPGRGQGRAPAPRSMVGVPFPETPDEIAHWADGDRFEDIFESIAVRASSALPPQGASRYDAARVHDEDPNTAWAPARDRHESTGAYVEFTLRLAPQTEPNPTLTSMVIFNGYHKSRALWQKNNRVRRLRMTVNGRPYGVISLADAYEHQRVEFSHPIPLAPHTRTDVVRFTILDIYRGAAYHDTPISEIEFHGTGIY